MIERARLSNIALLITDPLDFHALPSSIIKCRLLDVLSRPRNPSVTLRVKGLFAGLVGLVYGSCWNTPGLSAQCARTLTPPI